MLRTFLLAVVLAMAACLLSAADLVQEGDRWWSHIQVLAADAVLLTGRASVMLKAPDVNQGFLISSTV